jgi:hypothetical protein
MKYLRKIFESVDKEELLEFSENNLAYLIDEDFIIEVYRSRATNDEDYSLCIKIIKVNNTSSDSYLFKWNDIKDHFIPFIQRLINKYELHKDVHWWNPTSSNYGRPCKPIAGIMIDYLKPKNMFDNQWFKHPSERDLAMITPTTDQILNDEIHNDIRTINYGWNCMDYIYEINILIKE